MRSRFRLPRAEPLRVATVVLLVLLGAVVFANSWGVFQTDIKPEVYLAPGEMLPRYLSAWTSSPYLGSPNFNVGLVPVLVVTALLRAVGLDPEMAFKVYHLVLWALAAWGANRLLRTLVPSAGVWAGLLTGVAYIANPYAVAAGGTLAIALPMALLPWMLVALTRALREPTSWAWPAAVGLVFFGMSGMNVGVVPVFQLLLVIPLVLYVRAERGSSWRDIGVALSKSAAFVIVVSLYWLIPGAAASGTGVQIAESSESLDGIARTSSFVEVLRGLGLWSYYGSSDAGPWLPQYAVYFTSGIIILLTMLWPAAALLSLRVVPARLARFTAAAAGMVAVIMVGLYPGGSGGSAFSIALRWVLEHVGPLVAFRTTNKIGAGLVLVFALLIGWALVHALPRLLRRPWVQPALATGGTAVVVALVAPAVTGNLYVSPLDVPDYWRQAASAVDKGDPDKRVLLLPGQTRSAYRWSLDRPDDLPNSLFSRDAVIPETTPNTSAEGGNFLAALDDTFQSGTAGTTDISPFARYLGVDDVLLRHDVSWEDSGGARPGETARALAGDPGLRGQANFGRQGENMFTTSIPPNSQDEAVLSPLQLYGVVDSPSVVRATPADGAIVVAGDAWAIPPLSREGLLEGSPALRYAQDVSLDELQRVMDSDGRMALTDTNQRRAAITNRLRSNEGAVLAPDEIVDITRTLGDDPADQSTLVREGVRVRASSTGGAFFDLPHGVAENAIDGDPSTSWLFGDFGRAKGVTLELELPRAVRLGDVQIDTTALGPVEISSLSLEADGRTTSMKVDAEGRARADLDGVETDRLTLTVTGLRGDGFSLVGVSEIDLGEDLTATRTTRLPTTLTDLYDGLPTQDRKAFTETPLDVFFTRVTNTSATDDDTEQDLRRDFSLPDDRTYRSGARVRVSGHREVLADELSGLDTTYRARSSYTYFDSLTHRASRAVDEDEDTAWVPGGRLDESWWQMSGPERSIDRVTVTQEPGPGDEDDTAWATRARVEVDGEEVATGTLAEGTRAITLPRGTSGRTVRLVIEQGDDSAGERPPRFTTIDTGATIDEGGGATPCLTVATIDGKDVQMRPEDPETIAGPDGPATEWVGCGREDLAWGEHRLEPVDDVQLDGLTLRDVQGLEPAEQVPPPVVQVERSLFSSSMHVDVGPASTPYFLSIGQGFDPRWTATLEDGTDLGEPVVVDGYASGWFVDDLEGHEITVRYGPQTRADIGLALSGFGLLVALVVFFLPLARRRAAAIRASRESEWETSEDAETAERVSPDETDPVAPTRVSARPWVGLSQVLAGAGTRRPLIEAALVIGAAALTGLGGGLAALAAVVLVRARGPRPGTLITVGAGLLVVAAVAYIAQVAFVDDTLGTVSADSVKKALVPHHIAGAGLVLAVIGTYLRQDPPEEDDP